MVITRNVDLSVGSIMALTAYLTGRLFIDQPGLPIVAVAVRVERPRSRPTIAAFPEARTTIIVSPMPRPNPRTSEAAMPGTGIDVLMGVGGSPEAVITAADTADVQLATLAYGVGNWHFYNGRVQKALEVWNRILAQKDQWPAFGYLAAEAELARLASGNGL